MNRFPAGSASSWLYPSSKAQSRGNIDRQDEVGDMGVKYREK